MKISISNKEIVSIKVTSYDLTYGWRCSSDVRISDIIDPDCGEEKFFIIGVNDSHDPSFYLVTGSNECDAYERFLDYMGEKGDYNITEEEELSEYKDDEYQYDSNGNAIDTSAFTLLLEVELDTIVFAKGNI